MTESVLDAEPQLTNADTEAEQSIPPDTPRFGFGLTANTILFYTLIKGLQLTLYGLIFPLYAYSLGYNQEAIGRLNATGALMVFVCGVPLGMLADRVGRARLLVISAILAPISLFGVGFAQTLPTLVFWMLLQNGLSVVYWSATSPLLIGAVPAEQRVRVFSINSFFLWGLGALGSTIGGFVAASAANVLGVSADSTEPLRIAMATAGVLGIIGVIPLWRIRNVESAGDRATGKVSLQRSDYALFVRLLVPDILAACGAGALIGFLPLFFALRFGVEPRPLGLIFTLIGVLSGIAALSAPLIVRRLGNLRAISGMFLGCALAIGCLVTMPLLAGAVVFEAIRSGLRGSIDPIYTPYAISRVAPERRGTLAGLYNVTYATGFSLGPLISGWVQEHHGFNLAFLLGAGCYIAASLAIFLLWRNLPEEAPATQGAAA